MQGPYLRKYGAEAKCDFQLFEVDGVDFRVDAVHASGDTKLMKNEGAEANTSNGFVDEGQGYSITLTAAEMQAARIVIYVVDQTATKAWLDTAIVVETYGHASAQHAVDLDDSVRAGLTALPNAAADAAGGLAISDAGGLDLDAKLANTNEITAARLAELDAANLPADVAAVPTAAEVNAEVDTALADIHLDHLLAADYDPASKPGVATALLNELVENDGGVSRYTANALEEGPGGGSGLTAQETRDAMKLAPTGGAPAAGSLDDHLDDVLDDTGTSGVVVTAAERNSIADALLKRDWTAVSGEAARSALNALRFLRNKWSVAGSTLTVTEEDDSTSAWTATITTDAAADPVTASDPT